MPVGLIIALSIIGFIVLIIFITSIILFLFTGCASKGPVTIPDVSDNEIMGRSEKTTAVYDYIRDNFGIHILSAQQESTWMDSPDYERDYLYEVTGKHPALRGLDFMNNDFDGVVERAI